MKMHLPTLVATTTLTLAVTACSSDTSQGETPAQPEPSATAAETYDVELGPLAEQLEQAWDVECGDEDVDMAGYPKVVCGIPDDLMSPGMSSNAIALQGFTETSQAEDFRTTYVPDGDGFVIGDGWFVHAPTQEIADQAASAIQD